MSVGRAAALALAALGVAIGIPTCAAPAPEPERTTVPSQPRTWTVRWVIDGDTLDVVDQAGGRVRLRLVNINAPEVARDTRPAQCLGEEARDWLRARLAPGAPVRVVTYGTDGYGRTLADVQADRVGSVSTALAGRGLAAPLVVGRDGPTPVISAVREATARAAEAGIGLHSVTTECTVPARARALQVMVVTSSAPQQVAAARAALQRELDAWPPPATVAALTEAELAAVLAALRS